MAWHLIKQGSDQNSNYMEFMIDTATDINTPPTEYEPALSSLAHTPGYARMWELNSNGGWVEIGGSSN